MDYSKILENIMFQCANTDEVEEYFVQIATSVRNSAINGTTYLLFVDYANIYVKVREYLENNPCLAENYDCVTKQTQDAVVVHANLEFALKHLAEIIQNYLKTPIKK